MPAFDTHKAVKELCRAGFDDAQAEAVVDQIHGAVNENVATKADIEKLATREELRDVIANLATKGELSDAITKLATKDELREEITKLHSKLDSTSERFELRLTAELEKQANRYFRYMSVFAAAIVGLTKALDLLV